MRFGLRGRPSLWVRGSRMMRRRATPTHFTIQLVQRLAEPIQDVVPPGCETVDAGRLGPFGFGRSKPAAPGHAGEDWIQRPRTQSIAVLLQFLEHPLPIHAVLVGVVQNVDLPEGQEELAHNGIAHGLVIIALAVRNR
jgi:hypothetical protein